MKTRSYLHRRLSDRGMTIEDVQAALGNEVDRKVQADGRIQVFGWVERIGKFVRVIILEDGETVLNAMPDRNFTRKKGRP